MSLLNDILRDLSQHKPHASNTEGYDETLLNSASFTQKKHFPWGSLIVVFLVVFSAVLAINYSLHKLILNKSPENIAASVGTANEASKIKDAVVVTPVPSPINSASVENNSNDDSNVKGESTADATQKSEELANHIADLLLQAERALGMQRLTSPVEDNAYGYYQKILSMDASNEDAKNGLDEISKRYLAKAREQAALGNSQAADALVQRARFVSERFVLAHYVNSDERQFIDSVTEISVPESQAPESPVESATETLKPFNVVEAKSLSVSPNAAWKDEQLVQHAQELINQNKSSEAQQLLKNFIVSEKTPIKSASLLADIYLQQGNLEAAAIIANQATYLPVDAISKIKAQLQSSSGNDLQAITTLEKDLSSAEDNEAYRSLLASLYHKTANYPQSIISYQRLINRFGEKPAYWLGLALAYDGLSQHQNALQAYQRLRDFPQLQEQVTQYTNQRIAALRSE